MDEIEQLRAACRRRLESVSVPRPFDIHVFCQSVAAQRDRPIRLFSVPGMAHEEHSPYGLWLAYEDEDRVYVPEDTSAFHRTHIILHEIAHMLCEHNPDRVMDAAVIRRVVPDVGEAALRHMFSRHNYTSYEEREAETMATLIGHRIERGPLRTLGGPVTSDDRWDAIFGGP